MRRSGMLAALLAVAAAPAQVRDPFEFFKPSVTLGADDRRQLDRDEPVARIIPSGSKCTMGVQREFRRVVLQRIKTYLAGGQPALAPVQRDDDLVNLADRFSAVLGHSAFLVEHAPQFAEYLDQYPLDPWTAIESFLYWSRESLAGRPIVSVTHVNILRVYVNRSRVEVLDRWFGGVVRWFAERRVRAEAAEVLRGLRARLESGESPAMPPDAP